jgi:hypothetical protein
VVKESIRDAAAIDADINLAMRRPWQAAVYIAVTTAPEKRLPQLASKLR